MQIEIQHPIDDETAAAILAAVTALLSERPAPLAALPRRSAWALAGIQENHAAQPVAVRIRQEPDAG